MKDYRNTTIVLPKQQGFQRLGDLTKFRIEELRGALHIEDGRCPLCSLDHMMWVVPGMSQKDTLKALYREAYADEMSVRGLPPQVPLYRDPPSRRGSRGRREKIRGVEGGGLILCGPGVGTGDRIRLWLATLGKNDAPEFRARPRGIALLRRCKRWCGG